MNVAVAKSTDSGDPTLIDDLVDTSISYGDKIGILRAISRQVAYVCRLNRAEDIEPLERSLQFVARRLAAFERETVTFESRHLIGKVDGLLDTLSTAHDMSLSKGVLELVSTEPYVSILRFLINADEWGSHKLTEIATTLQVDAQELKKVIPFLEHHYVISCLRSDKTWFVSRGPKCEGYFEALSVQNLASVSVS